MKYDLPPGVEIIEPAFMSGEFLLFVLVLAISVLWYWMKVIVKTKGYPMNLFFGHSRDIKFMREVIATEKSKEKALHYRIILYSLYSCLGGLLLIILWGICL